MDRRHIPYWPSPFVLYLGEDALHLQSNKSWADTGLNASKTNFLFLSFIAISVNILPQKQHNWEDHNQQFLTNWTGQTVHTSQAYLSWKDSRNANGLRSCCNVLTLF